MPLTGQTVFPALKCLPDLWGAGSQDETQHRSGWGWWYHWQLFLWRRTFVGIQSQLTFGFEDMDSLESSTRISIISGKRRRTKENKLFRGNSYCDPRGRCATSHHIWDTLSSHPVDLFHFLHLYDWGTRGPLAGGFWGQGRPFDDPELGFRMLLS